MLARLIRISPHRLALTLTAAVLAATLAPAAGAQEKPDKPSSTTWSFRVSPSTSTGTAYLLVSYGRPASSGATNLDTVNHGSIQAEWKQKTSSTWIMRGYDFNYPTSLNSVAIPVSCSADSVGSNACTDLTSGVTYEARIRINSVVVADITSATTGPWSDTKDASYPPAGLDHDH